MSLKDKTDGDTSEAGWSPARRSYVAPKLIEYGEVRHLTQGGTQADMEDAMMMSTNMI